MFHWMLILKNINEYHSYMMTLKNGIILGFREHNPISDLLTSHLEWFNADQRYFS